MKKRILGIVYVALLAYAISGCGSIKIHDAEFCGDMGAEGAACFHMLSDDSRNLTKEEWDAERFGQVCTDPQNYADLKAVLLKFCNSTKKCTYDVKKKIMEFDQKLEAVMDAINAQKD